MKTMQLMISPLPFRPSTCRLYICQPEEGHPSIYGLALTSREVACGLIKATHSISHKDFTDRDIDRANPHFLYLPLNEKTVQGDRSWALQAVSENSVTSIAYINNACVKDLMKCQIPLLFDGGRPDWKSERRLRLETRMSDLLTEVDGILEELETLSPMSRKTPALYQESTPGRASSSEPEYEDLRENFGP